eukprot:TRINITY_DN1383_c0_g2_i1.p1 TRINITY_DN1383_c0_g2~~TRINITY_DN1383_c0_g2_i1.p1  ORF type:complete len:309 (-),score=120.03 TRINITY_DN1383_c0_g2_i1:108-1034(-)
MFSKVLISNIKHNSFQFRQSFNSNLLSKIRINNNYTLINFNLQRNFSNQNNFNEINKKVDSHSIKPSNAEYHRHSTRNYNCSKEKLKEIELSFEGLKHLQPKTISDKLAFYTVKLLRKMSNLVWKEKYIHYACVLETIAAVPGMVAGMLHHLRCLRKIEHDTWIKSLLDEAENERMHLMTFMEIAQPSRFERFLIVIAQFIYWHFYLICYIFSPRISHRMVGYLEEEATKSYTNMLIDIDAGKLSNCPAPNVAIQYWGLPPDSTLRDVIIVVRADEADHRDVNHKLSHIIDDHQMLLNQQHKYSHKID